MKVLHVSTHGSPAYGVSPYSDNLLEALRATAEMQSYVESLDYQSAYPAFLYPSKLPTRKRESGIHWAKPWTWTFKMCEYDVLHIQYWTRVTLPYLICMAASAKRQKVKLVITMHNVQPHERLKFLSGLEKLILRWADAIVTHVPAPNLANTAPGKHWIIPHGVSIEKPLAESKSDTEPDQIRRTRNYVLFFGNIRPYKGVEDLLVAWREICAEFPDSTLVIAGRTWKTSGTISRLINLIRTGSPSEVDFHGLCKEIPDDSLQVIDRYLTDEELDNLCRECRIVVFPYRFFDAQSGAACKACGLGKRLLVSRVGGLPDLVYDDKYCFDPGDTKAISEKLRHLLQESANEIRVAESEQMKHVEQFSWPNIAKSHWEMYARVCDLTKA